MRRSISILSSAIIILATTSCQQPAHKTEEVESSDGSAKIPVIFDTDCNNELDDQHALAYLLFNDQIFDVKGVVVNNTHNGGGIQGQYDEAERVIRLCNSLGKFPVLKGAEADFEEIKDSLTNSNYDGQEGVSFIIEEAKKYSPENPLVILSVGKLVNPALAIAKDPTIAPNIRLVWLGSNYPEPGEYNFGNDIPSMNYLLNSKIPFEMVVVRYKKPSGTWAVQVSNLEIKNKMPGLGPHISDTIIGRHGGSFQNFGDYAVSLWEHINPADTFSRALFDMAAVAIVKDSSWAEQVEIPAPYFEIASRAWIERPENLRKIKVWENFKRDTIVGDFFHTMVHTEE